MKLFSAPARREIALISAISALALLPIVFLAVKNLFGPRPTPTSTPLFIKPTIARLATSENSFSPSPAFLSPDGRWVARMEMPAAQIGVQATPGTSSSALNEVVIRSASNGGEVFRALTAGKFVGWIPHSIRFVAQNGLEITIFSPATRKPGAAAPDKPWTESPLVFPPGSEGVGLESYGSGSSISTLQMGAIALSPDFRFAVKASWGHGDVEWQIADLTTGRIATPIKAGRWLDYDPKVGGYSNDIGIAVGPANSASGAWPRVALLQTTRLTHLSSPSPTPQPTATPIPTATPAPTPTPSPAQTEFLSRASREEAAIQTLVESVLGVDGNEPKVTDEAEIARISAEVKRRNRALEAERKRLFPASAQQIATARALPTKVPSLQDAKPFRIECFDLKTRRKLWMAPIRGEIFTPQFKFSPDGAALVAWGTARLQTDERYRRPLSLRDTGIDIFAAATGKHAQFRLYEEDFSIPNSNQTVFFNEPAPNGTIHSILTVRDSRQNKFRHIPVLRFFDTVTARETGHLDIDFQQLDRSFQSSIEHFSCDDDGLFWLVGYGDFQLLSRSQSGREFSAPLPVPTPRPAP